MSLSNNKSRESEFQQNQDKLNENLSDKERNNNPGLNK